MEKDGVIDKIKARIKELEIEGALISEDMVDGLLEEYLSKYEIELDQIECRLQELKQVLRWLKE